MKITLLLITCLALLASNVNAKDETVYFPITDAMKSSLYLKRLDPTIRFYFADQSHADIKQTAGFFTSNKKTNGFNKTNSEACHWAMLSALLSLQDRAHKEGANAVINVSSFYKKVKYSSQESFECHVGSFVVGVALNGEVVELLDQ